MDLRELPDLPFYHILRVQRHEILHQTISMKSSLLGETIFANISELAQQDHYLHNYLSRRKRRSLADEWEQTRTNLVTAFL